MKKLTVLKLGLLAAAFGGTYWVAEFSVDHFENRKQAQVHELLSDSGLEWAMANPDGMQVVLTGEAPDEAARFRAITLVSQTTNPAHIRDNMTVAPPEDLPLLAYEVEILRSGDTVLMHGLVPAGPDAPVDFQTRVAAIDPVDHVSDVLTQSLSPAPEGWGDAAEIGLAALADLADVRVEITPGRVRVDGVAPAGTDAEAWRRRIEQQAPETIEVAMNLRQARQRLSPFTMRMVNDGDGVVVESCAVESEGDAAIVSRALQASGGNLAGNCTLALGAPDEAWPEAASALIASLSELGRGAITVTDNSITVLPDGSVTAEALSQQRKALRDALPPSYKVSMLATKGLKIGGQEGPTLRLTRSAEGPVTLSGPVGSAQEEATLAALSAARFGAVNVTSVFGAAEDLPETWGLQALAVTEALALLHQGEIELTEDAIAITGTTRDPEGTNRIQNALHATLGPDTVVALNVAYEPAPTPIATGPSPADCVAEINDILLANKITFAPGAVRVPSEALPTIDSIAASLRNCPEVPMEIGGHTDSQGREESNQLLSQARADAVLDALAARRVLTSQISAKGYGETRPIADNSTEEGREANRRIAFRLTPHVADAQESVDGSK